MSLSQRLKKEFRAVALTTFYFATWIGVLTVLKMLVLAEYQVEFRGLSFALFGALVVAKVVVVLERVSLGQWVRRRPALLDVVLRTLLYSLGVLVVLLLEKAFEARHEQGGFGPALVWVLQSRNMYHVWASTICVASALFAFNAIAIVRHHLGEGKLIALFLAPPPEVPPSERDGQQGKRTSGLRPNI